jgi:regulator of replication initiation timing
VQEDVRSEALWRELTSLRKRQEASDAEAQDTAARADAAQRRAHAEVAALEAERDDAIQEVTALRESLMAREAESAGMRKRVASLLDERTGAYAELDALRRELHARDVEVLNATQAREEAEVAMREAEQAKQAQAKDARRQLDELRRTWTHHLKSIEARVDKDNDAHRDEVADMKMQLAAEQSHVEALTAANAAALKPPRDRQGLIALWRRAVLHASGSFEAAWEDLLRAPGPRGTVNRASFDRYVETRLGLPPQGAIAQAIWVAIGGSSNGVIVFEDLAREDSISYRPTPRIRPDAARVSPRAVDTAPRKEIARAPPPPSFGELQGLGSAKSSNRASPSMPESVPRSDGGGIPSFATERLAAAREASRGFDSITESSAEPDDDRASRRARAKVARDAVDRLARSTPTSARSNSTSRERSLEIRRERAAERQAQQDRIGGAAIWSSQLRGAGEERQKVPRNVRGA